jgi:hypothetical protein
MNLQLARELAVEDLQVLITASSMPDGGDKLALVMGEDITHHKPVYNISPTTPLWNSPMPRREIHWHPRPRTLREFSADTQHQLRQLDFNRIITVCNGDKALYVRRIGLNKFLWRDASA